MFPLFTTASEAELFFIYLQVGMVQITLIEAFRLATSDLKLDLWKLSFLGVKSKVVLKSSTGPLLSDLPIMLNWNVICSGFGMWFNNSQRTEFRLWNTFHFGPEDRPAVWFWRWKLVFISSKIHGLKQFMNLLGNVTREVYTALNVSFFLFLSYVDCCTAVKEC